MNSMSETHSGCMTVLSVLRAAISSFQPQKNPPIYVSCKQPGWMIHREAIVLLRQRVEQGFPNWRPVGGFIYPPKISEQKNIIIVIFLRIFVVEHTRM